ncbi:MAG: CDP-diacylglycerol--glycerol-3-phosphate 3-phosphatidyltransferase [Betaproteobacteria bacterium TMED82]|nr:MAG: CDP-diacylglycerol--glycerol-3-phosphate 3-phosphatidyltransferase [Betaproteobacteria bacterium TMED82]|tara:strand:+ start:29480 stop:30058 length:579 start_codon:yes stop_codon:yes gene_type:complete
MFTTLPNMLTWLRILSIPFLIFVVYAPLSLETYEKNFYATVIFILAAVTDWVDGWLARRWNQTSLFGEFLDPVADKLMVCAVLVILIDLERVSPVIGIIIIGREIAISALREWMLKVGTSGELKVHWLGKAKTVSQMIALPCLLYHGPILVNFIDSYLIGTWLIFLAALLTVISMINYLKIAFLQLKLKNVE